jgi:DNA replication protein DnaC
VQNFKQKGGNLLLLGQTGCGKTFLSNCIAKALLDEGVSVIYFTAFELFHVFEEQTFKKNADVADLHDQIFDCDLLIIDDLGTESPNTHKLTELFNIINTRLLNQNHKITKTIISTNLNVDELFETYTTRIGSRLAGYYRFLRFYGDDLRFNKSKKQKDV